MRNFLFCYLALNTNHAPAEPIHHEAHCPILCVGNTVSRLPCECEPDRPEGSKRAAALQINNILSIKLAVQRGAGIAMLPDYVIAKDSNLVQLLPETAVPSFDTYFCYPDTMKNQAKLQVFRDFLISKARGWSF